MVFYAYSLKTKLSILTASVAAPPEYSARCSTDFCQSCTVMQKMHAAVPVLYSYQMLPEETNARRRTTFQAAYWIRLKPACITLHTVCVELNSILSIEWRYSKMKYVSATSLMHITITGCQMHTTPPHHHSHLCCVDDVTSTRQSRLCWAGSRHSSPFLAATTYANIFGNGKITANNIPVNLDLGSWLGLEIRLISLSRLPIRGNNKEKCPTPSWAATKPSSTGAAGTGSSLRHDKPLSAQWRIQGRGRWLACHFCQSILFTW